MVKYKDYAKNGNITNGWRLIHNQSKDTKKFNSSDCPGIHIPIIIVVAKLKEGEQ